MKKLFTNLKVTMTLLLLCGVCSAWGADETLTISGASSGHNAPWGTSYGTGSGNSTTSENTSVSISYTQVARMSSAIQIAKNTSNGFYSTSAPANKYIKSIKIEQKTNSVNLQVSPDGTNWTTAENISVTTTKNYTETNGYKYFKVTATSSYAQISSITVTYGAPSATYTVTLGDNSATLTETSVGSGVTLPSRGTSTNPEYSFAGWSTTNISEETTTAPTIIPAGIYKPTADITLYPVYSKTVESDFNGYEKVTSALVDWSGQYLLSTGTYTATGEISSNHLTRDSYTSFSVEATSREFSLSKVGDVGYSIKLSDVYLGWSEDGTDFVTQENAPSSTETAYLWTLSPSKISNVKNSARVIRDNGTSDFRPYSNPSTGIVYLYKKMGGDTNYYVSALPAARTLTSIEVSGEPAEFWVGDEFNHEGITVTANYDTGDPVDVTINANFSSPDMTTAGQKTVTVTYQDKETSYNIMVKEIILYTLTATPAVGGSYSVIVGDDDAVNVTDENKEFKVREGTLIQVEAIANEHYKFNEFNGAYAGESTDKITFGANGSTNKKKFTYGAEDAEITADFLQMYAVVIDENIAHGSITANPVEATPKTTVTLTLTPNAHYHFESVTVKDVNGDDITLSNGPTTTDGITTAEFKIPGAQDKLGNVSVTATFAEDAKYTVTFSVNGQTSTSEANYAGEAVVFPEVSPIGDKLLIGWVTEAINGTQDDAPEFVTNATYPDNNDAVYYAVFAEQEEVPSNDYAKISSIDDLTDNSYVIAYDYNGGTQIVMQNEANTIGTQLKGAAPALTSSKYSNPDEKYIWQINKVVENDQTYYTVYNAVVNKYVKGISTGLSLVDEPFYFVVSYDNTNNCFRFKSSTATTYFMHGYVSGTSYDFRSSAAGSGDRYHMHLYKNESTVTYSDYCTTIPLYVKISEVGWATACVPFKATVTGATAYYVTGTDGTSLTKVEAKVIPAETGILLKSDNGGEATVTFTASAEDADDATDNLMVGSLTDTEFKEPNTKYYILTLGNDNKVGFYWDWETNNSGASAKCPAGKAVLAVQSASAKTFFNLDDEATGINNVEMNKMNNGIRYNLNGQAVGNDFKGVVIVNGKKFVK